MTQPMPDTSTRQDRLYALLPAYHRERDLALGEPLRELLQVIEEQANALEDDLWGLYENWFIETCQDWVVPYLGDLIGYRTAFQAGEVLSRGREQLRSRILEPRRDVANTLRSRRRKGTLAILEELSADVAGWPAHAVEFFSSLGITQHVNHVHLDRGNLMHLRDEQRLEQLGTPFDPFAHTVDVRRISTTNPGRYNIPNVGLFVWRLRSYPVTHAPALALDHLGGHCYTFSPLGNDLALFSNPIPEPDANHISNEANVPKPILRRDLEPEKSQHYGPGKAIQVWIKRNHTWEPVPAEQVVIANLQGWTYRARKGQVLIDPELGRIVLPVNEPHKGLRVSYRYGFPADIAGGEYPRTLHRPEPLHDRNGEKTTFIRIHQELKHLHGSGTHTSDRRGSGNAQKPKGLTRKLEAALNRYLKLLKDWKTKQKTWKEQHNNEPITASIVIAAEPITPEALTELEEKLDTWAGDLNIPNQPPAQLRVPIPTLSLQNALEWRAALREFFSQTVIEFADSGVYAEPSANPKIKVADNEDDDNDDDKNNNDQNDGYEDDQDFDPLHLKLEACEHVQIRAANHTRPVLHFLNAKIDADDGLRLSSDSKKPGGTVVLNGLTITGGPVIVKGPLCEVHLQHCTLLPGWGVQDDCEPHDPTAPSLTILNTNARICIEHSIVGSIEVEVDHVELEPVQLQISDSIIDATGFEREAISTSDCLPAHATLCIKRSTVFGTIKTHAIQLAENSIFMGKIWVARRQIGCIRFSYITPESRTPNRYECQPDLAEQSALEDATITGLEAQRVRPQFDAIRYGKAEYARLSPHCALEILRGADDESEMGVYHDLFEPQRTANLLARLEEFTPAGSDIGLFKAS
jgi:hypothetical protein